MQINIPNELYQRLQQRSDDPVEVIREALDSLDFRDREFKAIEAGIASADAGRVKTLEQFDHDFRARNGFG